VLLKRPFSFAAPLCPHPVNPAYPVSPSPAPNPRIRRIPRARPPTRGSDFAARTERRKAASAAAADAAHRTAAPHTHPRLSDGSRPQPALPARRCGGVAVGCRRRCGGVAVGCRRLGGGVAAAGRLRGGAVAVAWRRSPRFVPALLPLFPRSGAQVLCAFSLFFPHISFVFVGAFACFLRYIVV